MSSIWKESGTLAARFWEKGILEDCPVYDMHGHMGPHDSIYFNRCSAEDMVAHMRRIGVRRFVFSHDQALAGLIRNEDVVEICKQFPDILRMYISINPHFQENIKEDLAKYDQWKPYVVGLKFLADYHEIPVTDRAYEYAWKFADERGIPVLNHTWGTSPYNGGAVMYEAISRYPNAKTFLGHCIFGEWDYSEKCINDFDNVYLELTAVPGERNRIEKLVAATSSKKILFGTDLPWFDEYQAVGGVLSAKITDDEKRDILYRNAQEIFGDDR